MNYFEEPNIPPLKEELHVEENIVLEDYIEVKEQNIEIFEEINEGLIMEVDCKIKIIVEENNEYPIIEKNLEVEMVETIEKKLKRKVLRISMKSNHMIVNLKILLFWW